MDQANKKLLNLTDISILFEKGKVSLIKWTDNLIAAHMLAPNDHHKIMKFNSARLG
jgi:hypothetical protein